MAYTFLTVSVGNPKYILYLELRVHPCIHLVHSVIETLFLFFRLLACLSASVAETSTHASPTSSCASNELYGLRQVFKEHLKDLLILNTKGFTGHPMGVSFEDVVVSLSL